VSVTITAKDEFLQLMIFGKGLPGPRIETHEMPTYYSGQNVYYDARIDSGWMNLQC
jgi:hypothetical protein